MFQNLFENVTEHAIGDDGSGATTVTVGTVPQGFYVADDGPGFPDTSDELFQYGTGDGSGMGLAIVRTIVEAHGWDVSLAENEDGGAQFEVVTDRRFD